jgi:glycosyltransferase involved in cell wall biosynthesis
VVGQDRATVVVGTFGARSWERLAQERAIPSAAAQAPVIHVHEASLARARNAALERVETEWVVHLDADDELAPDYVERMLEGSADVRAPAVRHVWPNWESEPEVPRVWGHEHDCVAECLRAGNYCCIGSMVRTELAREVGWQEFGWSEDWAMFAGCWAAGGTVESIPAAVYVAHHRRRSRNRVAREVGLKWHRAIERHVWGEVTA